MGTEKVNISGVPFTRLSTHPPFAHDDKWNELSSTSKFWSLIPSQLTSPYSDHAFSHGWLDPESFTRHSDPSPHPYFCFRPDRNTQRIQVDHASGQDARRSSDLLDTRKWSPSPNFASPRTTSASQFPLMDTGSGVSLSLSDIDGTNGFSETFASGNIFSANVAPNPQAILHTHPVPDFNPGFSYHCTNLGTDLDHALFQTSDAALVPSSGSTEDVTNFVSNQRQPLNQVIIYRPHGREGSCPSPSFVPRATSEVMDIRSDVSLSLSDGDSNDFRENFASGHILAANRPVAPKPRAIMHSHPVHDSNPGFSYHHWHANLGTYPHHDASFQESDTQVSSPSSVSTKDITSFVSNERQPPIVIYRPPERKNSGRRHSQRPCAINIEGLWIDKDDLYFGADRGGAVINVYECQWAVSSNPCGMWIIPSRSRVGTHIRKWHTKQKHAKNAAECLWDGCAEMMLKDSINRHLVTIHFGEAFHCQGCDREFPRKDVYNKHVEDGEVCRGAGVAMVYGTEHRVIDTRQALHRGTIRYAGR
ncbi:hypothetical protein OG21DRAFT_1119542 [Imleria badia]|nr:hypothetical protein OG21DRAFT_1119542 [Imleria badia]